MLKRIMKKLGPESSARLIETLYDLIVVKKMTSQALKKLEEGVGRPSKIHIYQEYGCSKSPEASKTGPPGRKNRESHLLQGEETPQPAPVEHPPNETDNFKATPLCRLDLNIDSTSIMSGLMWTVRAGEHGRLFGEFHSKNVVAIGWNDLGDVSKVSSRDQIRQLIEKTWPGYKQGWYAMSVSQVWRFCFEMKPGEWVITYDPERRKYLVGLIKGEYKYRTDIFEYHQIREVEWKKEVSRDHLSTSTRYALGSISALFQVGSEAEKEIIDLLEGRGKRPLNEGEEAELDKEKENTIEKAHELIKDLVQRLDPYEMQDLVSGILRAMGYKTAVSPKGADRGRDIVASPDGLGMEDPKIIVEVKHREGQTGREKLSSFIGGLRAGNKGLYVSTGGFTKEAKFEAERAPYPITLVDLDTLANLITRYYDNFDMDTRALVPLTKIYWPA